jgi:hypothetical protein
MASTQFHVVPLEKAWQVNRNGRPIASYGTREQAVEGARARARVDPPSQVIVHGTNGEISATYDYAEPQIAPPEP